VVVSATPHMGEADEEDKSEGVAAHDGGGGVGEPEEGEGNGEAGDGDVCGWGVVGWREYRIEKKGDPGGCEEFGEGCTFEGGEERVGIG
jgi:hypothetical protein